MKEFVFLIKNLQTVVFRLTLLKLVNEFHCEVFIWSSKIQRALTKGHDIVVTKWHKSIILWVD